MSIRVLSLTAQETSWKLEPTKSVFHRACGSKRLHRQSDFQRNTSSMGVAEGMLKRWSKLSVELEISTIGHITLRIVHTSTFVRKSAHY